MVGVAQLVEHWVVAPVVAGSSPVTHPIKSEINRGFIKPPIYLIPSFLPSCGWPGQYLAIKNRQIVLLPAFCHLYQSYDFCQIFPSRTGRFIGH